METYLISQTNNVFGKPIIQKAQQEYIAAAFQWPTFDAGKVEGQ